MKKFTLILSFILYVIFGCSAQCSFILNTNNLINLSWAQNAAYGDFNGDTFVDIASANHPLLNNGYVSILLGNGDGTFGSANHIPISKEPGSITTGDFNSDGIIDIITANPRTDDITILIGNGNGIFSIDTSFMVGDGNDFIKSYDFNQDSKLDIITSNSWGDSFSILLGNGNGTFGPIVYITASDAPSKFELADFDNDLKIDIAFIPTQVATNDDSFFVLYGTGNTTFTPPYGYYASSNGNLSITSGDFNSDLIPDIALLDGTGTGSLTQFRNNSNRTFTELPYNGNWNSTGLSKDINSGDFNGDGKMDLLSGYKILLGNGQESFTPNSSLLDRYQGYARIVDLNNDGKVDIINSSGDTVKVFINSSWPNNINEHSEIHNEIKVFPSPAKNLISLSIYNNLVKDNIKIYDIFGNLKSYIRSPFGDIDVSTMSSGVYLLEANFNNQIFQTKFIKE